MRSLLRPSSRQLGALGATITAAIVLFGQAAPASATGASGTVDAQETINGSSVYIDGKRLSTQLFRINLDGGGHVRTYCIDFTTPAKHNARMVEDDWANYPNTRTRFTAKPAQVNWILNNSFPHLELDALRDASGVDGLDKGEAIAGTQLAIWHFSNDTKPDENRTDADIIALYEHLTGEKNTGLDAEPAPTLKLAPEKVTGKAGSKLGPLTVKTTAGSVKLEFTGDEGAKLTDAKGAPVSEATNGTKLYVDVPDGAANGKATIAAKVSATIKTGRLFRGDGVQTQTLITASNSEAEAKGKSTVTWKSAGGPEPSDSPSPSPSESASPSPEPSTSPSTPAETPSPSPSTDDGGGGGLPNTGVQVGLFVTAGLALVAGGAALFYFSRRRKTA